MANALRGAAACVLSVAALAAPQAGAATLLVTAWEGGELARLSAPDPGEWCLHWAHSVTGGAVADCFAARGGVLVLTRSYLHDFAAGLGHIPGRGTMRSAEGGGYWIEGIDEPMPEGGLVLRIGTPRVGHRLVSADGVLDLSAIAAGQRVRLVLDDGAAR
jgi:hypothetical protein